MIDLTPTYRHDNLSRLEGLTLHDVSKTDGDSSNELALVVSDETGRYRLRWVAEGDCCAQAWVEAVNCIATLPAVITGREDREGERQGNEDDFEVLDICFYSLRTDKGHVDVELRVSHNGYYGGWLDYAGGERIDATP